MGMYIQDKVKEYADEIFERMDAGAHMYFCGLKGMMPGITEMLEGVSAKKGIVWEERLKSGRRRASGTSRSTKRPCDQGVALAPLTWCRHGLTGRKWLAVCEVHFAENRASL